MTELTIVVGTVSIFLRHFEYIACWKRPKAQNVALLRDSAFVLSLASVLGLVECPSTSHHHP